MRRDTAGLLFLCVAAFIAGNFVWAAFLGTNIEAADPADTHAVYCEGATDGWLAAHHKLYAFVQTADPELFATRIKPIAPDDYARLNGECLKDVKIRAVIHKLAIQSEEADR